MSAAEIEALEHYIKESDGITVGIPVELAYALIRALCAEESITSRVFPT